jgi:hypothetical protein
MRTGFRFEAEIGIRENKKPDSEESGLAVEWAAFLQPRRASSAHDHRRQADPCQRARLTIVTMTTAAAQF